MSVNTQIDLRVHSLEVILDNQQASGAFLACPNMPDYRFSWFRDGAYIVYALTVDGSAASEVYKGSISAQWENVFRFQNWCAQRINERAERVERAIAAVQAEGKPDMRDVLNARYRADGVEGPDDWPEFQLDGLGTWLWSLQAYVERFGFQPMPTAWAQAAELTARYLAALWRVPCYDCWEELGNDVHISTLATIYAGLQAAEKLIPGTDYKATCADIRAFVLEKGLTPTGELAKSVGIDRVDANLLMVATPHRLLEPDDPIMVKTVNRIERELHAKTGGVHRHLNDVYYGGGAWVLLELHLAWYYAEKGDLTRAKELLDWCETTANEQGDLPEQVITSMLAPDHYDRWVAQRGVIASPLLWSHAEYLIVKWKLAGLS